MAVRKCPKCGSVWYTALTKCAFCGVEGEEVKGPISPAKLNLGKKGVESGPPPGHSASDRDLASSASAKASEDKPAEPDVAVAELPKVEVPPPEPEPPKEVPVDPPKPEPTPVKIELPPPPPSFAPSAGASEGKPPPPKDPTLPRVPVFRKEPAKPTLPTPPKAATPPPPNSPTPVPRAVAPQAAAQPPSPRKDPTPAPVLPLPLDREAILRKAREAMDADLADYGFPPSRPAPPAEDESWYRAGPLEVESPPLKRIESHAPASVPKPATRARRLRAPLVLGVLAVVSGVILVAVLRLGGKLPSTFWPH